MAAESDPSDKVIAQNRRARHDYQILETFEAGLVLKGVEVKSLRQGKASLAESYATVESGEVFLRQFHIPPYEQGNRWNQDPVRARKLLLHKREIDKLWRAVQQKGQTLVPLKVYFTRGKAKVLLGVGRGKRQYDKRASLAERDAKREVDRARRAAQRGRN